MAQRIIMHVDLDAFFAAVEQREKPELKGKAVVVGADPKEGHGRGVVSTASYEARKFGVKSAMPITRAWRLCAGQCVFVPVQYERYAEVSANLMKILKKYADKFEPAGIDEAYLDVSRVGGFEKAKGVGVAIRKEVLRKERLTCSIGIGPNKLIAKIASDYQKPDGLTVVGPRQVWDFLATMPVRRLYGIGPKTAAALAQMNVQTVAQLRRKSMAELAEAFGSFGREMYEMARGIDERPLVEDWEAKQIGRQITFEEDTDDKKAIWETVLELVLDVHNQLRGEKKAYRTVTIKVRYEDFETHTAARTLIEPTQSADAIATVAKELFEPFLKRLKEKKIRLVGVSVSGLVQLESRAQRQQPA